VDSRENKADYGLKWQELLRWLSRNGLSSKMFADYYLPAMVKIWPKSLIRFPKSGIAWRGECLMLNTSEWLKDAKGCSLSEVLETQIPSKYYLSKKAVQGMIRRSLKWGRGGYVFLQEMKNSKTRQMKLLSLQQLEAMTTIQQETQNQTISLPQQSEQAKEVTLPLYGKTLILRKLTPLEKERLMGFPENWTMLEDEV